MPELGKQTFFRSPEKCRIEEKPNISDDAADVAPPQGVGIRRNVKT